MSLRAQVATLQARVVELERENAGLVEQRDAARCVREQYEGDARMYRDRNAHLTQQLAACEKQWRPIAEAKIPAYDDYPTDILVGWACGGDMERWTSLIAFFSYDGRLLSVPGKLEIKVATHFMPLPPAPDSRTEEKQ